MNGKLASYATLGVAIFLLSACGGSSTTKTGEPTAPLPDEPTPPTYSELLSQAEPLFDSLQTLPQTLDMPVAGSAEYAGFAGFNLDTAGATEIEVLSQVLLQADFANSTIDAEFFDFTQENGEAISAQLDVSDGSIFGNKIAFDINGVVTRVSGDAVISGSGNGGFLGDEAAVIGGGITGTLEPDGEPSQPFEGFFFGNKAP